MSRDDKYILPAKYVFGGVAIIALFNPADILTFDVRTFAIIGLSLFTFLWLVFKTVVEKRKIWELLIWTVVIVLVNFFIMVSFSSKKKQETISVELNKSLAKLVAIHAKYSNSSKQIANPKLYSDREDWLKEIRNILKDKPEFLERFDADEKELDSRLKYMDDWSRYTQTLANMLEEEGDVEDLIREMK